MDTNDLIQVLWIEDDPEVTSSFPLEAESEGIQLVPYGCWDDGYAALLREYDRWQAIVLDAKCKYHKDSRDMFCYACNAVLQYNTCSAGRGIPSGRKQDKRHQ